MVLAIIIPFQRRRTGAEAMKRGDDEMSPRLVASAPRCLWFCLILALLVLPFAPLIPVSLFAQSQTPVVQIGRWTHATVVDWQSGTRSGVLITNNAGGELRLEEDRSEGTFVSAPFETPFAIHAVGAVWRAQITEGTNIRLDVRGRSQPVAVPASEEEAEEAGTTPVAEPEWGPWQSLVAGDARSQADDGAFATPDVVAFPLDTRYLQLRITLLSDIERASAVLNEVTIVYLDAVRAGPATPHGLQRTAIISGVDTLTPRPMLILRSTWFTPQEITITSWEGSQQPTRSITDTWNPALPIARINRVPPRGVIVHQIDAATDRNDVLPFLRALTAYQVQVLGWDDLAYHYIIDDEGTMYEGRSGGPTAAVSRLSGGGDAIHVALIHPLVSAPTESAQASLVSLLAWAGQAFAIPPTGEHPVLSGEERVIRRNIVGHGEVVPEAPDPGEPLRELLPTLRERANQSMVRARWYFAEGNSADYTERLVFFNPGKTETNANITLLSGDSATPLLRIVAVPPEGRTEVVVNELIPTTTSLPVIVESSGAILAERSMALPTDIDHSPGIAQLSRVWYFAEGSTDDTFHTYFILFNPHSTATTAMLTYMKGDGTQVEQSVALPANQRVVVTVRNQLPGAGFGTRIIATQPIAAERTMRFGPDTSGFHSGPGMAELSQRWYFAEGTTAPPFAMRILILNPNHQATNVTVTFMTPDGTTLTLRRRYAIPPTTRLVIDVNEVVPTLGVATTVESDRPIAVERALYFSSGEQESTLVAGTVSAGARQLAFDWRFVDGRSSNTRQFLLLSNPNRNQARVTLEFIFATGERESQTIVMPGNSRYTAAVHELYPNQPGISMVVRATQPIVAERSLFPVDGGGSTVLGMPGS